MKKNIFRLFVLVLIATMAASAAYAHDRAQFNWSYKIKNGTIITKVPKRPQGQKDAIKLTVPKISTVRVGFAGLGWRGNGAVTRWCQINGIEMIHDIFLISFKTILRVIFDHNLSHFS